MTRAEKREIRSRTAMAYAIGEKLTNRPRLAHKIARLLLHLDGKPLTTALHGSLFPCWTKALR